ncbi:hypothetical protein HDK90DRAFT_145788 [Phyllosticta capitalensis]|uniref:Secreted protein n=1 Tax=Phyllosticta capitalensis TaxID=121624 RepID=A0ABR1YZL5_9PEZI
MPLTHRRALHISLKTMSLALAGVIHTNLAHAQPLSSTVRRQRAGSARGSMWPCNSILVVASIGHSEMEKKRQFALMPYHGFRGPLYTHSASANEAWAAPLLRYPYLPHSDCRCQKFTHGLAWGKLCRRTAPLLPIRNVCWSAREIFLRSRHGSPTRVYQPPPRLRIPPRRGPEFTHPSPCEGCQSPKETRLSAGMQEEERLPC